MSNSYLKKLEYMSWCQLKDCLANGIDSIITGIGSTEQHGPHLPILTDSLIAEALCDEVSTRVPQFISGLPIRLGVSPNHLNFCGTISMREETLKNTLVDYINCVLSHGFKLFLFVTHGGNFNTVEQVVNEYRSRGECKVSLCMDKTAFIQFKTILNCDS